MKTIVITHPVPQPDEAKVIDEITQMGVYRVHLRRPSWCEDETRKFLDQLSPEALSKIVLHDCHDIINEYPLAGLHYNSRHVFSLIDPHNNPGTQSVSCHSLEEVDAFKSHVDYLFLSPIFDSISKDNYHGTFTHQELLDAGRDIDQKVFALGGISLRTLPHIYDIPFGGIALLGAFWQSVARHTYLRDIQQFLDL